MTRETFDRLVAKHERFAARSPRLYRARVRLLGWLGYAVMVLVVLAPVIAIVLIAALLDADGARVWLSAIAGLTAPLLIEAVGLLRIRLSDLEGLVVTADAEPELFRLIEDVGGRVGWRPVHRVVLTSDLNAAAMTGTRLGPFGARHTLIVGLPLISALPEAEFRAIVAHELAHFAADDSIQAWACVLRTRWEQLGASLRSASPWMLSPVSAFLSWYSPYFDACTQVLARQQEVLADREAANATTPEDFASGLVMLAVLTSSLHDRIGPGLVRMAASTPEPPEDFQQAVLVALTHTLDDAEAAKRLGRALAHETAALDTHPSLSDRLARLGFRDPAEIASWTERWSAPAGRLPLRSSATRRRTFRL